MLCAEGVTVGQASTLYYDRLKGALPSSSKLIFKAGLNRWESIQLVDMGRAEGLLQANGSEWWSVDITMPKVPCCQRLITDVQPDQSTCIRSPVLYLLQAVVHSCLMPVLQHKTCTTTASGTCVSRFHRRKRSLVRITIVARILKLPLDANTGPHSLHNNPQIRCASVTWHRHQPSGVLLYMPCRTHRQIHICSQLLLILPLAVLTGCQC